MDNITKLDEKNNHETPQPQPIPECIEVPKVFDECLIKRCLRFGSPASSTTDPGLRQVIPGVQELKEVCKFVGCRDFNITLDSVTKIPINGRPGYKRISINFTITFKADVQLANGNIVTLNYTLRRSESGFELYCPDAIAQIAARRTRQCNFDSIGPSFDLDPEIVKLEMIADCLDASFVQLEPSGVALNIVLGFYLIVKCELIVQLIVLSLGYCQTPGQCSGVGQDPCTIFNQQPVPDFFPPQKQRPRS